MRQNQKGWLKNMVLLIDTNVILDVLANRTDFVKDSSMVWNFARRRGLRDMYLR